MIRGWESVRTFCTKLGSRAGFKWFKVMGQFQNMLDDPAWGESGFVPVSSKQGVISSAS